MPSGGCLCGGLRYEYVDEGSKKIICHCRDCHKMTGSAFGTNIIIPASSFTLHGNPKHYSFKRGAGGAATHTTSFCANCGTTVSKNVSGFEKFEGMVLVKAGTLDEGQGFDEMEFDAEAQTKTRVTWLKSIADVPQFEGMP
ncbi:hypothetical protein BDW02DRAFT_569090 [Decorospora gaudefroyi]|uniref:CENP-V/GFA domain-containing protein n=1 Tax=Decorospora gaudefroyi TaxID=184978 RepID=A0A6A5KGB6_9PLEO|nr:hypothetical protein BDW02DRAFT_569090 [Decorospora gaudefroyi]